MLIVMFNFFQPVDIIISESQLLLCSRDLSSPAKFSSEIRMSAAIESMSRYVSPVNPAVYPHLTLILLSIGIFFMAWFLVYEVTGNKYTRDLYKELLVAMVASLFMGFGILFLLLWVGIYV